MTNAPNSSCSSCSGNPGGNRISAFKYSITLSRKELRQKNVVKEKKMKNLYNHAKSIIYLLSLFNAIFSQNIYPPVWKTSIILPFLKPNADPTFPVSYRLGKLFQKILNKRHFWYLESNNHLSPVQYGYRKSRNTSQALAIFKDKYQMPLTPTPVFISSSSTSRKLFPESGGTASATNYTKLASGETSLKSNKTSYTIEPLW